MPRCSSDARFFARTQWDGAPTSQAPRYRGTIGVFSRNMLVLGNVGQSVRRNLPKLWRHLPATGRDLQILQI
jgi:hypothetical protein